MSEIYYRAGAALTAAPESDAMTRLRSDQMLRAVRLAAGFGLRPVITRSGQILGDDEPGGDDARVIEPRTPGESETGPGWTGAPRRAVVTDR